jgi:hypothetical protein
MKNIDNPYVYGIQLLCLDSVYKVDVTDRSHFVAPLTGLTRRQRCLRRSDCCATRQSEADRSQVQPRAP